MNSCCNIPFRPAWGKVDGDWVFQSTCPSCGKVTECNPHGADMQELHRILAREPKEPAKCPEPEPLELSPEEAQDARLAMRIMADFRAWHSRADRTIPEIEEQLLGCIAQCQNEMSHPETREKAIQGFRMMVNRLSEFQTSPEEG